jgi:hypothetical protein
MKITRAIFSCDSVVSDYYGFKEIVIDAWNRIDIRPTLVIFDPVIQEVFRFRQHHNFDEIKMRPVPGIPVVHQAQIIRYFAATLFHNEGCILSDIDMLPLNRGYFHGPPKQDWCYDFFFYSSDAYTIPEEGYPVCYVAGTGKTFTNILGCNLMDFPRQCAEWMAKGFGWRTDEKVFAEIFHKWHRDQGRSGPWVKFLNRGFKDFRAADRIDRGSDCRYNPDLLKQGYYKDFHMPRPFRKYAEQIGAIYTKVKAAEC